MRMAMAVLLLVALTAGCTGNDGSGSSATTPTPPTSDPQVTPAAGTDADGPTTIGDDDADLEGDIWFKPGDATFEPAEDPTSP